MLGSAVVSCLFPLSPWQARLESGKGDKEEEARVRSVKFNTSTENLKDCTMHILAQVAALAKARAATYSLSL